MTYSPKIITTADGSSTLYIDRLDEQYHSVNGAITESQHVFLKNGLNYHADKNPLSVLEIGFGTGLNALLTAIESEKKNIRINFYTLEKYPLDTEIICRLNFGELLNKKALFQEIHNTEWNRKVDIISTFSLKKIEIDVTVDFPIFDKLFDVIYFDAFGPDKQPEMWQPAIFQQLYDATAHEGVIVTYSAKGEVRRRMAAVGYSMQRLEGPPGKREMLRGEKVK